MLSNLGTLNINKKILDEVINSIDNKDKYFIQKNIDRKEMLFSKYIEKYYSNLNKYDIEVWNKVIQNLVMPGYDKENYMIMIKNMMFVSPDVFDFQKQDEFYQTAKLDNRLDESLCRFIGFMAGCNFFTQYKLTLNDWFHTTYWSRPGLRNKNYPEYEDRETINNILNSKYGLNYLKATLPNLLFWRR